MRDAKGNIEDRQAFRKALEAANFKSVRGDFKIAANHNTVQDYYLRQVVKDGKGRVTNKTIGTILTNHSDAYAGKCRMN